MTGSLGVAVDENGWGREHGVGLEDDEIRLLVNYGRPGGAMGWDEMDARGGDEGSRKRRRRIISQLIRRA